MSKRTSASLPCVCTPLYIRGVEDRILPHGITFLYKDVQSSPGILTTGLPKDLTFKTVDVTTAQTTQQKKKKKKKPPPQQKHKAGCMGSTLLTCFGGRLFSVLYFYLGESAKVISAGFQH